MRKIVEIGRAERNGSTIRFKEKGTLERHDFEPSAVEKLLVRVAPRPEKQILADFFLVDGPVYRINQERTIIDYRSFFEDIELSGIENFRRFIALCVEWLPEDRRDGATVEFGSGGPPEAFATKEEFLDYEAAINEGAALPPRPTNGSGEIDLNEIEDKVAKAQAIWREYGEDLEAAEREADPSPDVTRNISVMVIFIGFLIAGGGVGAALKWLFSTKTQSLSSQVQMSVVALIGLCVFIGIVFMVVGLTWYRRSIEPPPPSGGAQPT